MKLRVAKKSRRARIEIVPLIDIMFFLLATFVMVSTSMIKNRGIVVNLPKATSGTPQERKEFFTLTVSKEGAYFIDKQPVAADQLAASLQLIRQQNADPKVFINGDESAKVSSLVAALDEVRKSGITKVALETESKSTESK
jgi:biopolymer transport protein ExbD